MFKKTLFRPNELIDVISNVGVKNIIYLEKEQSKNLKNTSTKIQEYITRNAPYKNSITTHKFKVG